MGAILRLAYNYSASLINVSGSRINNFGKYINHPTNVFNTENKIPVVQVDNLIENIPFDCCPVAIELLEEAKPIFDFEHPKNAYYIFGAEDGTLGKSITMKCAHVIYIPMQQCLNLSHAVGTVLYDRCAKSYGRNKLT
jgi:tRNA(Leu) C34 or U34 (ribose-2'-O)-methylase TrmL